MSIRLRDLLQKKTPTQEKNYITGLPQFPLEGYDTLWIPVTNCIKKCDGMDSPDNYNRTQYPQWTIPTGTRDVIFELWGGGGSGSGSTCCEEGPPGGSGAYAYKRLMGSEVVPGCAYDVTVSRGSLASAVNTGGVRGCSTYIIGHNLTNLCAEGGHGGISYCTNGQGGNMERIMWTRSCETECRMGCCAMHYGADSGAHGLPGYFEYIGGSTAARCCNGYGFPYPGGLVNSKGGWVFQGSFGGPNHGKCEQERAAAQVGMGGSQCFAYVPGFGGGTSMSTGSICNGSMGHPGAVRISWK